MTNIQDVSPVGSNTSIEAGHQSVIGRMLSLGCSDDGQVVYTGSYSNLWKSDDAGQNFDQVAWPQPAPDQFGVPGAMGGWCVVDIAVAPGQGPWSLERHPRVLADLTGTGRADIVGFGEDGVWVSLGRGDGGFQEPRFAIADFGYEAGGWRVDKHPRMFASLTGHRREDFVGFGDAGIWTALSNGDGTFQPAQLVVDDFGYEAGGWRVEKHPRLLAGLTGTQRDDFVGFGNDGVWVALSNGAGGFQPAQLVMGDFGYEAGGWRVEKHPRFLADVTGTRRSDIVGFGDAGVYVAVGKGDGTFDAPQLVIGDLGYEAGGWRVEKHPRFLADVTGTGVADIVGFGDAGVYVALSKGDGTFDAPQLVIPDFGYEAGGWRVEKHPRLLADLTGTGTADIIGFGDAGVYVALSKGDGTFESPRLVIPDFGYEAGGWRVDEHLRFLADLTGTGRADVVGFGNDGIWIALSNGDGTFQAPRFVLSKYGSRSGHTVVALARNDRERTDRGIWRSTDGGNNWARVHGFVSQSDRVGQLVWAPGSDRMVYAATGSALAVSQDGGATFQDVFPWGSGPAASVHHVAVAALPERPSGAAPPPVIYTLGNSKVFVSFDGGMSWIRDESTQIPPGAGSAVGTANANAPSVLVVSPRSPLEVYLVANDASLWRGDYTQIFGSHTSSWESVIQPQLGPQDSGNVFLVATQPRHGNVLYYGPHRTKAFAGPLDPVSPSDWHELDQDSTVHVDLHGMLLSPDFTASFQDGSYDPGSGTMWLLSDGGLYRSTDGGNHFHIAHNVKSLSSVNVAGVAVEGQVALSLNTGDNDGFYSLDGGAHWTSQHYGGGDNDCSYADPLQPNMMLVFTPRWDGSVTLYVNPSGLPDARISTTQAHTIPGPPQGTGSQSVGRPAWNALSTFGMQGSRPFVLTKPGETAPEDGDLVFIRFRTDQRAVVLRTRSALDIDSPDDWDTQALTEFEGQRVFQQGPILPSEDLGVLQASGGHTDTVFYVGGNSFAELWTWANGMTGWKRLVPAKGVSVARRFFVDPYRPHVIYVLDRPHIVRSEDGGQTWQVDASLEEQLTCGGRIPIERDAVSGESDQFVDFVLTDMVFDPYRSLTRFAVGEAGAFFTNDGATWHRLLDTAALPGRPTNCYYDWISDPCNRALYVAFAGRSLVKITPLPWGGLQAPDPASWSSNVEIQGHQSKSTPAVAQFQGVLHMVRNAGNSNDLVSTTSTDGLHWEPAQPVTGQRSRAGASIAEFGGVLHMVHLGDSSNHIWWSTNDGTGWTTNVQIPNQLSQTAPALASFAGKLYMMHTGDSSNDIWISTFNGTDWDPNTVLKGQASKSPVKLAAYGGRLHMVHLGDSSNDIWWSVFDGTWWSNTRIRCQRSASVPALAVHDGLLHMVHRGDSENTMWWSLYDGDEWTPNVTIPHQLSKTTAALIEGLDQSQLLMLHLGDSSNRIWFSAS